MKENESPLQDNHAEPVGQACRGHAQATGDGRLKVDWAMRYGQPSIPDKLQALKDEGCDRILVFPLYPQYSATTTATVNDVVCKTLLEDALAAGDPHSAALSR